MANTPSTSKGNEEKVTTILADDLDIKGTMKFKSSLMIKGTFEGEIISEGLLIVGPTAMVAATITSHNLISHGEIMGDVTTSEQVVLKSTSTHTGNITTPNIIIESGSLFNGSCIMEKKPAVQSDNNTVAQAAAEEDRVTEAKEATEEVEKEKEEWSEAEKEETRDQEDVWSYENGESKRKSRDDKLF